MWKNNVVVYLSFVCNKNFVSIFDFFINQSKIDFGIIVVVSII